MFELYLKQSLAQVDAREIFPYGERTVCGLHGNPQSMPGSREKMALAESKL